MLSRTSDRSPALPPAAGLFGNRMRQLPRRLLIDYWPILLVFLAWQLWVMIQAFSAIVMPSPSAVLADLITAPDVYLRHTWITLSTALIGLLGGMLLGSTLAVVAWTSRLATGLLTPVTVMFSSVPVVALIPVIARILGYDTTTVVAVAAIITFFPSFVFLSAGLRALPPGSDDLFRVLGSSRLKRLLHLALPAAMPNLAIALRLAAAQAILAAMVAEFLMGTAGLGYLFSVTLSEFHTERAFGASLVATAISLVSFLLATRFEHRVKARFS